MATLVVSGFSALFNGTVTWRIPSMYVAETLSALAFVGNATLRWKEP